MNKDVVAIVFLLSGILVIMGPKDAYGSSQKTWQGYIDDVASQHGVDPDLIRAIIMTESGGNPSAVRHDKSGDSLGLMQVTMIAAKDIGYNGPRSGLLDPKTNIEVGTAYFAHLLKEFHGNTLNAIGAYNAGPTNVKRGYVPRKYIEKVLKYYYDIKEGKRYF